MNPLEIQSTCLHQDTHDLSSCLEYLQGHFEAIRTSTPTRIVKDLDLEVVEKKLSGILQVVHTLLRTTRNATLPAMSLPPEVLGVVFNMIQDPVVTRNFDVDGSSIRWSKRPPYLWIRVTHVCRYWREVAFSCPSLWTNILVDGTLKSTARKCQLALTRSLFRNSRTSLLNVFLRIYDVPEYADILMETLAQLHRIRELRVITYGGGHMLMRRILPQMSTQGTAPHLERLELSILMSGKQYEHLPALSSYDMSNTLRSLAVYYTITCIAQRSLRNLRQLHLLEPVYLTPERYQSLVDLLDSSPALEDLMFSAPSFDSDLIYAAHRRPSLPSLRRLAFVDAPTEHIRNALASLLLPEDLSLFYAAGFNVCDRALGEVVPRRGPDDSRFLQDFNRVHLYYSEERSCTIFAAGTSFGLCVHDLLVEDGESLDRHFGVDIPAILRHARDVWIDSRDYCRDSSQGQYRLALAGASALTKLFLFWNDSGNPAEWLEALGSGGDSSSVLCPLLSELHVIAPLEDALGCVEVLARARQEAGAPLEALYVYLPLAGYSELEISRSQEVFEDWKASAPFTLQGLVGRIEFTHTDIIPHIEPPPVCRMPSIGPWKWPTWEDAVVPPRLIVAK